MRQATQRQQRRPGAELARTDERDRRADRFHRHAQAHVGRVDELKQFLREDRLADDQRVTDPLTAEGSLVGTFQYMAPEQVEGKEATASSDIFSFGSVLYEMATGKRAFEGKSQISVASSILEKDPPPVVTIIPTAPPALDHVIRGCLAKDSDARWHSAGDVARELRWIATSSASTSQSGTIAATPLPVGRRIREAVSPDIIEAQLTSMKQKMLPE